MIAITKNGIRGGGAVYNDNVLFLRYSTQKNGDLIHRFHLNILAGNYLNIFLILVLKI